MLTMLSIPRSILERAVRVSKGIRGGKEEWKRESGNWRRCKNGPKSYHKRP